VADIDDILQIDEAEINAFVNEFNARIDAFKNNVLLNAGQLEGDDLGITFIDGIVDSSLEESGYYQVINEMVNTEYQNILNSETQYLEDIVKDTVEINDDTLQRLMQQKEVDLQNIGELTNNIQNKMSTEIFQFSQGNITRKELLNSVNKISSQFGSWTNTWIDTSIAGFKSKASTELATAYGIEKFKYLGPDDNITRPFCGRHLSEVKTIAEWNQLSNEQINPVSVYRGGYNCRHRLVAVV
jgi:hypothetical protein